MAITPRREVVQSFNRDIQERLANSTFADPACNSWYKTAEGRITNNWPGTVVEYQQGLAQVRWAEYEIEGDQGEIAGRRETRIGHVEEVWPVSKTTLLWGVSVAVAVGGYLGARRGRRLR